MGNYIALNAWLVRSSARLRVIWLRERGESTTACLSSVGDGIVDGGNLKRNLFPVGGKEVTLTLAETVIIGLMLVQIVIDLYLKKAS